MNLPAISRALGPYIPSIVVNCIILGRQEAFTSKNPLLPSLADTLGMGLGFTFALVILGSIRELLGSRSIFGYQILGSYFRPRIIMILPPGAFLTLGILNRNHKYPFNKVPIPEAFYRQTRNYQIVNQKLIPSETL